MALMISLTFSLVLVLSASGSKMRGTDCTTGAEIKGCSVKDPDDNCSIFYISDGAGKFDPPYPIPCPTGTCFDKDTKICTIDCKCLLNPCHTKCIAGVHRIYDPKDCSKFSICQETDHFDLVCNNNWGGPYFNGHGCVEDEDQCCTNQPPTCSAGDDGKLLADPKDPSSYYVCVNFGATTPTMIAVHNTCPVGNIFGDEGCHIGADVTSTTVTNGTSSASSTATTTPSISSSTETATPSSGTSTETATPSSGTSTAKTTTTTPGCTDLSDFTCPPGNGGYYARCSFCHSSYFDCTDHDAPRQESCSGELVFNTNPDYPKCIIPGMCPFDP